MGILQSPCSGNCFIDRQEVQGHSKQLNGEGGPGANKHHIGEGVQGHANNTLERGSRGKQISQ